MTETKNITSDDKVWGAISYVWILSLVALASRKNNEYVRFHANQGFLLFLCSVVAIITGPFMMIINLIIGNWKFEIIISEMVRPLNSE